jgi:DDE superfamily endonuclease
VARDEFALHSVPNTPYAWALKTTAPTVPSDERNRKRRHGFLTVDLERGTTQVDFRPEGKTADVVCVRVLRVWRYVPRGFHWITVILDNACTHRHVMETAVREVWSESVTLPTWEKLKNTTVEFLHTPPDSPAFNPAEYLIHWVRQAALYPLPWTFTLQDQADRVHRQLAQGPPFTPKHMHHLLCHIYNLPRNGKAVKWPKLE